MSAKGNNPIPALAGCGFADSAHRADPSQVQDSAFLAKLHEVSVSPSSKLAVNSPWASGGLVLSHRGDH